MLCLLALTCRMPPRKVHLKICNAGNPGDVAKLVKEAKEAGEPVEGRWTPAKERFLRLAGFGYIEKVGSQYVVVYIYK